VVSEAPGVVSGTSVAGGEPVRSGVGERGADLLFELRVAAFAEAGPPDPPGRVDQVGGGPVVVAVGVPGGVVVVDGDRVARAERRGLVGDVARVVLEREFRGVHADHIEAGVAVGAGPLFQVGKRAGS
jgi:hypothetical protein